MFDLQRLICLILGTCGGGGSESTQTGGENVVNVGKVYAYPNTSGAFRFDCDNGETIYAAEIWFSYDSTIEWDVGNLGAAYRTNGWDVAFSEDESDPSMHLAQRIVYPQDLPSRLLPRIPLYRPLPQTRPQSGSPLPVFQDGA